MTSREGVPLAVIVSAANQHDVRWLLPLVLQRFPVLRGRRGRPRSVPRIVRADSGYTSKHLLALLNWCGIAADIPQRGSPPTQAWGNVAGRSNGL